MINNLKPLVSLFFAILSCFLLQISLSQATDDEAQKKIDSEASKTMRVEKEKEENLPVELDLPIPPVAQGHEDIYKRFLGGVLIYRPQKGSEEGRIDMPIAALANPLEGTFDLSQCSDAGQYLSISTGYKKRYIPENTGKVEIWISPWFSIPEEDDTTDFSGNASYFKSRFEFPQFAPVGLFWTWGGDDKREATQEEEFDDEAEGDVWSSGADFITDQTMDKISKGNLYKKWGAAEKWLRLPSADHCVKRGGSFQISFNSHLQLQTATPQVVDDETEGKIATHSNKRRCVGEERRPVAMSPTIPPAAQGYEKIYLRFLKGVLVYKPRWDSEEGRIDMPIAALANPLGGTFDLSRCGNDRKHLSISTGYRKGMTPDNALKSKLEIWICPRFLIERDIETTASHFKPIMHLWKQEAPVGLFWTDGDERDFFQYDYLIDTRLDELSGDDQKLSHLWWAAWRNKPATRRFHTAQDKTTEFTDISFSGGEFRLCFDLNI